MRHPHHDAVAAAIRDIYRQNHPEMGWTVEERPFGVYRRNVKAPTYPSVILRNAGPGDVPAILADAREHFRGIPRPVRIMIDDPEAEVALGPALAATGVQLDERTQYLAHVGRIPKAPEVPSLTVEVVEAGGLVEYEDTRARGFANADGPTPPGDLSWRVDLRRAEMEGGARYWLARIDGEPAGAMSWIDRPDRMIFSLSTRIPLRKRGIASHLICRLLAESERVGARSVIINADEADTPIDLYRRLGFTDEVYWHATYELALGT